MDGTAPGSKKALRTQLWAARRARLANSTGARRDSDAGRLAEQVMRLVREQVGPGATVTSYESYPAEPGTRPLNRALVAAGYRVIVPVTLPDLDLDWRPLDGAEDDADALLGRDAIGEADLLLIPGTAVDRTGVRLGQGGGCYDRALPRRRDGVPVVTLLHPGELLATPLPRDDHDQLVDAVVTACGTSWLRRR
ncbi:5-formyltetrahydrofolate cyclo-ligase [Arsenicicoccus dermatophilus]|uniref:5-formyltetrahydrofolate cyclo-ligase n=1 Tax=Arsenicicoccus dermatophilus TaxID=1076331 RepID=UPI0039172F8C